jgi:FkbM family methyltransferase
MGAAGGRGEVGSAPDPCPEFMMPEPTARPYNSPSFRIRQGRSILGRLAVRWTLAAILSRRSRRHLAEGRRQLAVFSFDHIGHEINLEGVYDREQLDLLVGWFAASGVDTRGYTALDVGANIGNHALFLADHFRQVVAFEPHPVTFGLLRINAALVDNVVCFNHGLSSAEGQAQLRPDSANLGASTLRAGGSPGVTVVLRTLDAHPELKAVRLVKIDVEGHELDVLQGGKGLLLRERPIVVLEQRNDHFVDGESPALSYLREIGYCRFGVLVKTPPTDGGMWSKYLVAPLRMLISGRSLAIEVRKRVEPGDYTFIVALPDWFPG